MLEAMVHGFLLAFGLIIPLGVQNVFILNQGLNNRSVMKALPAAIAASLCDTALVLLAVSGVSAVVMKWTGLHLLLLGAGCIFLVHMGVSMWRSGGQSAASATAQRYGWRKQVAFAVSVSLLNPHAIMDTIGVIGTTSLSYAGQQKAAFTLAVIVVSWAWFVGLAAAGSKMGSIEWAQRKLDGVNKGSALILWGTAVFMGWKLYSSL